MDNKTRRTLRAFNDLTPEQMKEFFEVVLPDGKVKDPYEEKASVKKRIDEIGIVMGPLGGTCPYCGK